MLANSAAAQLTTNPLAIKIASPTRGQQIPVDTNGLKINGFSSHTDSLHCNVYVIFNGIKPYQKVQSDAGNNNSTDYSAWTYYLAPTYTKIKFGTNKVTSKLACDSTNNTSASGGTPLTKFYSVNFTGISGSGDTSNGSRSAVYTNERVVQPSQQTQLPVTGVGLTKANETKVATQSTVRSSNPAANNSQTLDTSQPNQLTKVNAATLLSTAGIVSKNEAGVHQNNTLGGTLSSTSMRQHQSDSHPALGLTTAKTNENGKSLDNSASQVADNPDKSVSNTKSKSDNTVSPLVMSIHLSQRLPQPGERENMTLGVTDGNKTHPIAGAAVFGRIVDPAGVSKKLEGVTDSKGKVRYSWVFTGDNTTNGAYRLTMSATAPGYQNNSVTKMLRLAPVSAVSPTIHPSPLGVNNYASNLTNRPEPMPLASSNVPSQQTGMQPNQSLPLIPKQSPTNLEDVKKVNGRVYIPSGTSGTGAGALPFTNGKVSIPASTTPVNITSNSKVSVPSTPRTPNSNPFTQEAGPTQRPLLPNNNDKTPFIIATPILHITNGTSEPGSGHLSGIAAALNMVDRMRFLGLDSIMGGLNAKTSTAPASAGVTQKNAIFIPSSIQANSN